MKVPLKVVTWRLGHVDPQIIEKVMTPLDQEEQILNSLYEKISSIFYLQTCQRVILGFYNPQLTTQQLLKLYFNEIGITYETAEVFEGFEGVRHLIEVICSLDSVVVGEDQIQHQFKKAFAKSESRMDPLMKRILQHVIRTGKRARARTFLRKSKKSTISAIIEQYPNLLQDTDSIGIVGTGKMAKAIIESVSCIETPIFLYSKQDKRVGSKLKGNTIRHFSQLAPHDVLFLATEAKSFVVDKKLLQEKGIDKVTIFDLGMPRNCNPNVEELDSVHLITISDLLQQRKLLEANETSVYDLIDEELESIAADVLRTITGDMWKSFRNEVYALAKQRSNKFIQKEADAERYFEKFLEEILHISQKKMEQGLLEVWKCR